MSAGLRQLRPIIVTGASGYIGRRLVRLALEQGRNVTVLGRSNLQLQRGARFAHWELGDRLPPTTETVRSSAIIHLAHDWRDRDAEGSNTAGTRILLDDARERGVPRFVFASSLSARSGALNAYGRIKFVIEQLLGGPGDVSARVGLVYGGARQGMYGLLMKLVAVSPILPMIDPARLVQPIHVDEVCRGLLALADGEASGWMGLAGADPLRFGDLLKILAQEGRAASLRILPIPLRWALFAAAMSKRVPIAPRIDEERILGLAGTPVIDCRKDLAALGIATLPLREGLRRDAIGTHALLQEARVNCGFVLGTQASSSLMRRYVRAIRALEELPGPLPLPRLAIAAPTLLRFFEPFNRRSPLARRLRVAAALVEMSADYFPVLARISHQAVITRLVRAALLVVLELLAFPMRILATWRS